MKDDLSVTSFEFLYMLVYCDRSCSSAGRVTIPAFPGYFLARVLFNLYIAAYRYRLFKWLLGSRLKHVDGYGVNQSLYAINSPIYQPFRLFFGKWDDIWQTRYDIRLVHAACNEYYYLGHLYSWRPSLEWSSLGIAIKIAWTNQSNLDYSIKEL